MLIKKHSLLNKILLCGASLVMISSTGASVVNNTVNAKRIHYSRITRAYHHKHHYNHHKHLAYDHLIASIKSYCYHRRFKNVHSNKHFDLIDQKNWINDTINDNYQRYSRSQAKRLLNRKYSKALFYFTMSNLNDNLTHSHYAHLISCLTNKVNQLSKTNGTLPFNKLLPAIRCVNHYKYYSRKTRHDPRVAKIMDFVNKSITQDAGNYSYSQIRKLYNSNYYYDNGFNKNTVNAINNQLNNVTPAKQAWNNRGNNIFADQVAQYEYDYINQARKQNGLKSLPVDNFTQEIANMRSKQCTHDMEAHDTNQLEAENQNGDNRPSDNLAHGYDYHDTTTDDAQKLGIKDDHGISENAGAINQGHTIGSSDSAGDVAHFEDNSTPQDIAYNNVNDMLNYDRFTQNGHRDIILDKNATGIGVSAYYHPNGVIGQDTNYAPSHGHIIQDYSYGNNPANV